MAPEIDSSQTYTQVDLDALALQTHGIAEWDAVIAELRIARRVVEAARAVDWALGEPQSDWEPQLYGASCELHDAIDVVAKSAKVYAGHTLGETPATVGHPGEDAVSHPYLLCDRAEINSLREWLAHWENEGNWSFARGQWRLAAETIPIAKITLKRLLETADWSWERFDELKERDQEQPF